MGNISQKDIEIIESYIKNSDSIFDDKIKFEYKFLKNYKEPELNETNLNKVKSYLKGTKIILNPINSKKKIKRLIKWFKMGTLTENKSNSFKTNSCKTTESKSSKDSNNKSSLNKSEKKSNNDNLDNFILNYLNINFLSQTQKMFENNLKHFYFHHKLHFIERVKKGPPDCFRWLSWLIILNVPKERKKNFYEKLLNEEINENLKKQIVNDLNRTINQNFEHLKGINSLDEKIYENKKKSLYKILYALTNLDKEMGYCQGINFITYFLLDISDNNEIDTFYILISLFSKNFDINMNIRGFFIENFPLLQTFLYIFDKILEKEDYSLFNYIKKLNVPHEGWILKWFQTLFTICLPTHINLRLWDYILSIGIYFMISFSISLLIHLKNDLFKINDAFDFIEYFNNFFESTFGDGTNSNLILLKDKNFNNYVLLDDILNFAGKIHKNYVSKNYFLHYKEEYFVNNNIDKSFEIYYNLEENIFNNDLFNFSILKESENEYLLENEDEDCNINNTKDFIFHTQKKHNNNKKDDEE